MEARYRDGNIEVHLYSLMRSVDSETKLEMLESLACDDEIIKHVADQIITKWTESGCSGGSFCTAAADATFGLDWAWREVAKKSSDVAKREIERLEDAIRYKDKRYEELLKVTRELREGLSNCR